MTNPRILVVSNVSAPFVLNDVKILSELASVRFLKYRGRRDLPGLATSIIGSDVVVCWFALGYATSSVLLGRVFGKPTVLIAGGWDVAALPEIGYGAMLHASRIRKTRYALEHATYVIAVSRWTQTQVQRWTGRAVEVLYNAVDTSFFAPSGPKEPQVVTVAELPNETSYRAKGVELFLQAAARMPDVPFLLVGTLSPPIDRRLREVAPRNVRLLGHLDSNNIRALYQQSRVYVQLSAHESFGVAVVEAMSCGCAPVVSDRAALPEVVDGAGYVVQYGNLEETVAAIRKAIEDDEIGTRARERVQKHFSFEVRREGLRRELKRIE